jgi:hypothetical protein
LAKEYLGCIEVAAINANGTLGPFAKSATSLATSRIRHGASVLDNTTGPAAFTDAGATATTAFLVVAGGRHGAAFVNANNLEYALIGAGGTLGTFAYGAANFSSERDGTQFQIANGFGSVFVGGSLGNGAGAAQYTATSDRSAVTLTATTITFSGFSNAGANLNGAKRGRLGVADESGYFYLVGGTSNDNDVLTTVFRTLH